MPVTSSNAPLQKFRYRVTLGAGGGSAAFQKVSGLKREIEVIEYNESNSTKTMKLRGREKVSEITLEKGMYSDTSLESLFESSLRGGDTSVLIELLDANGQTARRWQLEKAWASSWESGDLDAGSSDIAIEKIVLQYESITN